jgi:viroplasmin and RNaseH domain-containing protein
MQGPSWNNAIESLNEYIGGLQNEKIEGDVTIVAFDSTSGMEVRLVPIVENKSIAYFEPLKSDVLMPAGMTPLYDAAANVMDRALERNNDRTVVVILTDGHENASKEYTQAKIKSKVELLQAKNWEVIFLGANFDVTQYTKQAGLDMTKMRSFDMNNAAQRNDMTMSLRSGTVAYASTGAAINLSESK